MKKLLLLLSITLATTFAFGQATGYVLPNFAASASMGTAPSTVDVYSRININQTTASVTLTVPNPTNTTTKVAEIWIGNIGSVAFTLTPGGAIDPATAVILKWTGSAWYVIGKQGTGGGGGSVASVSGTTNRINSTGGATPIIDISSAYVGQPSITTVGTVGAGTWQGGAIQDAYISSASTWNAKQAAFGTQAINTFYGGPLSGGVAVPTFRTLALADMPRNIISQETGVIYNEQFLSGTVAANYVNTGSTTWTLGSNIITVNNGAAGSGSYLTVNNYKVASDKFQFTVTTKVGDINTAGLMYGIPYFLGNFQFGLETTTSSASYLKVIQNGLDISSNTVGPTLTMPVSSSDLIDIKCTYNVDEVFITATNITAATRPTISFKFKIKIGIANSMIGIGKLAIFSMGGANHGFTKFSFRDLNKYNPEYVLIGDSITAGATVYNEEYTYKSNLYNAGVDLVKLACGQANIDDFNIPEFINYLNLINPKKIILALGSNQISASGGTVAFAKYQAFITRLNNAGFTDITFCTVLDRNTYTTEVGIFNTAIYANLPANKIVHLNSIVGSFSQFDDGIHPGAAINELMSDAILQHLNISKDYSKNKNNEIRTQIPVQVIKGSLSGISPMGTTDKSFVGSSTFSQFNYRGPAMIFNYVNNAVELITYNNIAGTTMGGISRAQYGTVALASANAGVYSIFDLKTKTDNNIPYYMSFANSDGLTSQIYNRNGPLQLNDIYGWHLANNTSARISGSGSVYFKLTKPSGSFQTVLEFSTYNGNGSFGGSYYHLINDASNNLVLKNSEATAWQVNTSNQFGLGRAPLNGFVTVQHGTSTSAPIVLTPSLTLVTTSASGTGTVATIGFATQLSPPFYVGQMIAVLGITPTGYNATVAVTACTTNSVSYLRSTTGAQTVAGTVSAGALATTPIAGAIEYDGTRFYTTSLSLNRQTVAWLSDFTNPVVNHLIGGGATPTIAAGAGAGTGPTISVTGTDLAGYITITTGTLPTLSAAIATITFALPYSSAPRTVQITPAGPNSAALSGVSMVYVDQSNITPSSFPLTSGTTALTAATTYKWYYSTIQ